MSDGKKLHPKVEEAKDLMQRGRMDRREFVRVAALLGVGAGTAYAMAGLPDALAQDVPGANVPFAAMDPAAQKGGTLRVAMEVQKMEDPATYSWVEMSNQSRHIVEYLSFTGPDNVTRPMLADRWEPSDDLKTWTLHLREGVKWHNGEELTAEHVKWNFDRWLDPATASSNIGLSTFAAMVEDVETGETNDDGTPKMAKRQIEGAIEVVDPMTIRLKLSKAVLSVPEDLYNYPTAILHPSFEPPFSDNPIGTGPYRLTELVVGERCFLERVTETTDGEPFEYWGGAPYLDAVHYFNFDTENQITAFASGDVDTIYQFSVEQMELAKALPGEILAARTGQTLCCRMQVDKKPFDDINVRKAVVLGVDNEAIKQLIFGDDGDVGNDYHVAPVHPEHFPLPPNGRDVEAAKKHLADAGYADGLELTIDVGNTDGPWHQQAAEIMRDQLAEIGIRLNINVMPATKYWEIWTETPFGATAWTHRPLGTMVPSLAYRTGVPWNETNYANSEFDAALDVAESIFDVEERKAAMEKVERILQDDAVMVQPVYRPVYTIASPRVHNVEAHPTQYHQYNRVWVG